MTFSIQPSIRTTAFVMLILGITIGYAQKSIFITPKASVDLSGTHTASVSGGSGSLGVNTSGSIAMEFLKPLSDQGLAGIGIMYLIPREQEIAGSGKFNFVPVYVAAVVKVGNDTAGVIPSFVMNIGYNMIYTGDARYSGGLTLEGGLYLGGGFRIGYERIFMEGLYRYFTGRADLGANLSGGSSYIEVEYSALSIGIGLVL